MTDDVFSKILTGESDASFVYRDNLVSAFLDSCPINPGHTLVVPNRQVATLNELDDETAARLFNVAKFIAEAIRKSELSCDGINLLLADGEVAGQEVLHTHLHVIPRLADDNFNFVGVPTGEQPRGRAVLDTVAEIIRNEL